MIWKTIHTELSELHSQIKKLLDQIKQAALNKHWGISTYSPRSLTSARRHKLITSGIRANRNQN